MSTSVLTVDDNESVRRIMRDFLKQQSDWDVQGEAGDGVRAIEAAIKLKPDVILLDYLMPNMNGIETASILRKMLPEVLIVLFTMFDKDLSKSLSSKAGVDLVISKPEGLTNLVNRVEHLLETAGMKQW